MKNTIICKLINTIKQYISLYHISTVNPVYCYVRINQAINLIGNKENSGKIVKLDYRINNITNIFKNTWYTTNFIVFKKLQKHK